MSNRENRRKIEKMVFNRIDTIFNESVAVSKSLGINGIHSVVLDDVVKKYSIDVKTENLEEFAEQFNMSLEHVIAACDETKDKYSLDHIPTEFLKSTLAFLKDKFKEGMKQSAENRE